MNEHTEDLKALYFEFGRTAEMAQVMEFEAGNLALTFVSLAFDPTKITDEERHLFKAVKDDINSLTFGFLLKQIRKIGSVSEGIENIFKEALERRNYLAHRFFPTHNLQINSEQGRKEMLQELTEMSELFCRAHATLSGMTDTLNQIFGRPNISQKEAIELIEKGKKLEF